MKKVVKKTAKGPSKFLIGALIFSWTLLAMVLVFRHKLFDESEDLTSTGGRQLIHQTKQAVENKVIDKVNQKLQESR